MNSSLIDPVPTVPEMSRLRQLREDGSSALKRGDAGSALALFEQLVKLSPHQPSDLILLATTYLQLGRLDAAIPVLLQVAGLVPRDAGVQKLLGSALRKVGRTAQAVQVFRNAIKLNPGDLEAFEQLCETSAEAGQWADALEAVGQMFVLTSKEPRLLRAYAAIGQRLNRADEASRALQRLNAIGGGAPAPAAVPTTSSLAVVNVEITTFCNLKCTGCCRTVGVQGGTWKNKHMSLEQFQRVVNDLPETGLFVPYGIGEPMLHPQIFEIVRIAKSTTKFKQVMLTSNALSRPIEDYHRLFELGLNRLCISVDSLDPELIDRVRPGTDVEKLTNRIRSLAERFPGKIEVRSVVGKNNLHALPDLLTTLNGLGRMDAYFQPYDDVGNSAGCMTNQERLSALKILEEGGSRYPNLKIVPQNFVPAEGVCSMPWDSPFITADGKVTPCCRIADANIANFGNALDSSFNDVWNGSKTQTWREDFKRRSAAMCKGCPMYVFRKEPAAQTANG